MKPHIFFFFFVVLAADYSSATGRNQGYRGNFGEDIPPRQQVSGYDLPPVHSPAFGDVYLPLEGDNMAAQAFGQATSLDPSMYTAGSPAPLEASNFQPSSYLQQEQYILPPNDDNPTAFSSLHHYPNPFFQQSSYQPHQYEAHHHYYGDVNSQLAQVQPTTFQSDTVAIPIEGGRHHHDLHPNILESSTTGSQGHRWQRGEQETYELPPNVGQAHVRSQAAARVRASRGQRQRLTDAFWEETQHDSLEVAQQDPATPGSMGGGGGGSSRLAAIRFGRGRQQGESKSGSGSMTARVKGNQRKGKGALSEPRSARLPRTGPAVGEFANDESHDEDDADQDPFNDPEEEVRVETYRAGTQAAHDHRVYTRQLIKGEWRNRRLSFRRISAEEMARQFIEIKLQNPGYEQSIGKQISHIVRKATEHTRPDYISDFIAATNTFTDRVNYLRKKYVYNHPGATLNHVPSEWVLDEFHKWLQMKLKGKAAQASGEE